MDEVCLPTGKKITELKVAALQKELSKRRLSKVGRKNELIVRLAESILHENNDNPNATVLKEEISEETVVIEDRSLEIVEKNQEVVQKPARRGVRRMSEIRKQILRDLDMDVDDIPLSHNSNQATEVPSTISHQKGSEILNETFDVDPREFLSDDEEFNANSQTESKRKSTDTGKRKSVEGDQGKFNSSEKKKSLDANKRKSVLNTKQEPLSAENNISKAESALAQKRKSVISERNGKSSALERTRQSVSKATGTSSTIRTPRLGRLLSMGGSTVSSPKVKTPLLGPIILSPSPVKVNQTLITNTNNKTPIRKSRLSDLNKNDSLVGVSPASKSIKKKEGASRFRDQHAKEFAKMESIAEHQDRLKARHEKLTGFVPDVVKRLATPKSAKVIRSRLPANNLFDVDPLKKIDTNSFKFGNVAPQDIQSVQKAGTGVSEVKKSVKPLKTHEPKADVKKLTKSVKLTIPLESTHLEFLATPKGNEPVRRPLRKGYTPRKGVVKYVDTSKLNDEEFAIAVKAGLIPKSARVVADYARAIKRDQLLDIKRKLHMH